MESVDVSPETARGTLHHLGIVVPGDEHDRLVESLRVRFGGEVVDAGEDDPLDVRWTWISGPGDLVLEVVAPRSEAPTPITRFLTATGGGLHHASFQTAHLDACAALMHEQGARTIGHQQDHGGWNEFFLAPDEVGRALLHWMEPVTP